jgi:hypothetical protein
VIEGHFQGVSDPSAFIGTAIIVAHDPTYEEKNGARIQEAREQGGSQAGACLAQKAATAP